MNYLDRGIFTQDMNRENKITDSIHKNWARLDDNHT